MERIISAMPFYYGASKEAPNTALVSVELQDEVRYELLRDVVSDVMERYPYFMVKPVVQGNEYVLEENREPVAVVAGTASVALGGGEANGHLLAFSCEANRIYLSFFHGLADGAGIFPLLRSVLYYYCREYYDGKIDATGIRLIGSPIPEEEREEPYPLSVDEGIAPMGRYKGKPAFQLRDGGRITSEGAYYYRIRIPEDAFIKYTKANDGSPATMVSVFLYRAIAELHEEEEKSIVCGMAMNIRPVLNKPMCHHSVVSQLFLEYKPSMKTMDIQTLATCSRGMVLLQSQPENVWTSVRNNLSFFEQLGKMPELSQRQEYMKQVVARSMQMDTYKVSYVGKAALGGAEKYVRAIESYVDIGGAGIMVEINALNGYFHLCFMQEFAEDVYVNSFIRQMEKEGIPCEKDGGGKFFIPEINL